MQYDVVEHHLGFAMIQWTEKTPMLGLVKRLTGMGEQYRPLVAP